MISWAYDFGNIFVFSTSFKVCPTCRCLNGSCIIVLDLYMEEYLQSVVETHYMYPGYIIIISLYN